MGIARKKTQTTKHCNIYINYNFVHFPSWTLQRTNPGQQQDKGRKVGYTVGKTGKKMAKAKGQK